MTYPSAGAAFAIFVTVALSYGPVHAQTPDTCNRAAMDEVMGQTSFFVTQVIYDIAAYAPEQVVRFLRPGDAPGPVRESRLTVVFDGEGRATQAYCG